MRSRAHGSVHGLPERGESHAVVPTTREMPIPASLLRLRREEVTDSEKLELDGVEASLGRRINEPDRSFETTVVIT